MDEGLAVAVVLSLVDEGFTVVLHGEFAVMVVA